MLLNKVSLWPYVVQQNVTVWSAVEQSVPLTLCCSTKCHWMKRCWTKCPFDLTLFNKMSLDEALLNKVSLWPYVVQQNVTGWSAVEQSVSLTLRWLTKCHWMKRCWTKCPFDLRCPTKCHLMNKVSLWPCVVQQNVIWWRKCPFALTLFNKMSLDEVWLAKVLGIAWEGNVFLIQTYLVHFCCRLQWVM